MNFIKKIAVLILLSPFCSFGQKLSPDFIVTTGTEYGVVDAQTKEYYPIDDNTAITVKIRGELVTLQRFDTKDKKEVSKTVYNDFPKYSKFQDVVQTNNKMFYIFEAYNKKEKTFSVYSREVNTSNGTFNGINKLFTTGGPVITSINPFSKVGSTTIYNQGPKFEIIQSFDKSKILIRYRRKPLSKSDKINKDLMGFYVFDNSFNKSWGKEVTMPHTEKEMNNLAYTVTSNGNAFMLSYLNESKKFEAIQINNDGLTNKTLDIPSDLFFQMFKLSEAKNGNIIASGYYANGIEIKVNWTGTMSASMNVNGAYIFEINQENEVEWSKKHDFTIDFIKLYRNERQQAAAEKKEENDNAGINDLILREANIHEDGSIILLGEISYTRQEMYGMSQENVTHFANMVIMKLNSDGTLVWLKKLPKNQAALLTDIQALKGLGMKYIDAKNAHYVLFVDNRKNATLTENEVAAPHKGGFGGYLCAFKIDHNTGNVEKHLICDLTDVEGKKIYQFSINRIFKSREKTFLVEYYAKDKKDNLIELKLK